MGLINLLFTFAILAVLALGDTSTNSLNELLMNLQSSNLSVSNVIPRDEPGNNVHIAWAPGKLPEPASEALWCKSISKGTTLLNAMSYTDADAGKTFNPPRPFARSFWDLSLPSPWGWSINLANLQDFCDFEPEPKGYWGMGPFLRSKGLSAKCTSEGGKWVVSQVFHGDYSEKYESVDEQTYVGPDQRRRRMTAAEFIMALNGNDGGCITFSRHGCEIRAADLQPPVPPADFPSLRQSSDVLWALWEKDVSPDQRGNINFFLTLSIENTATLQVIRRALEQTKRQLTQTPAIFDMTTEEGRAILGSPNAIAFAYMLIQHKDVFVNRIIDRVEVMEGLTSHKSPIMFFRVATYAQTRKPPGSAELWKKTEKTKRAFVREHRVMMVANSTLLF
ncbi:hypothetical protein T440DRAFT_550791 [Plenodomus tracheiphilus IPT5]|uniref:Uncharacterized protein n=1 Tax=Plenodomus tracheiphilus IPT5 TaxID=1408161 RepID=A0A6A7BM33_9PLEO|nr:hypothetical protein T440DRAFT_550791 [Plenodomus tracheiphilus IPT5]